MNKEMEQMAEALRNSFSEVQRLRGAMFKVYATAANGGDVSPQIEAMRSVMDIPWSGDESERALAALEAAGCGVDVEVVRAVATVGMFRGGDHTQDNYYAKGYGVHFSREDSMRLSELPRGTKLYVRKGGGVDVDAVRNVLRNMRDDVAEHHLRSSLLGPHIAGLARAIGGNPPHNEDLK